MKIAPAVLVNGCPVPLETSLFVDVAFASTTGLVWKGEPVPLGNTTPDDGI